jgi:hypothetical protein
MNLVDRKSAVLKVGVSVALILVVSWLFQRQSYDRFRSRCEQLLPGGSIVDARRKLEGAGGVHAPGPSGEHGWRRSRLALTSQRCLVREADGKIDSVLYQDL